METQERFNTLVEEVFLFKKRPFVWALFLFGAAVIFLLSDLSLAATSSNVAYIYDFGSGSNDSYAGGGSSSIFFNALTGTVPNGSYTTADNTLKVRITDVPVSTIDADSSALNSFDTAILYEVCDIAKHPATMTAINNFVESGGKLMIFDADNCGDNGAHAADYGTFLFPFTVSAPGMAGSAGSYTVVEPSTLTRGLVVGPQPNDDDGDANTFMTYNSAWCGSIVATNAYGNTGFVEAYARTNSAPGLVIYEGEDFYSTTVSNHLRLVFDNMLEQSFNPDSLPCPIPGGAGGAVNGACGSANGGTFTSLSSTGPGLCASGTVISFAGSGPWTWVCQGSNGGSNSPTCSANIQQSACNATYPDFSSTTGLTLSGNAAVVDTSDGVALRLVPASEFQSGSAFSSSTINAATFSTSFRFRLTNPGGESDDEGSVGADGFVFVIQNISSSIGSSGGGLGYEGIKQSVGIEFDTYYNPENNDPSSNHLGIDTNGSVDSIATVNVSPNFDDGNLWYAWIDYDGTTLEVRASENSTRPATPLLSFPINIPAAIGSNTAYIGFTAGTGSSYENQDILLWDYSCNFNPGGGGAVSGVCGTSNGGTFSAAPTSDLCAAGTASSPALNGSQWQWTCTGADNSAVNCAANYQASPVGGNCGRSSFAELKPSMEIDSLSSPRALINEKIDEGRRVVLMGNTRPEAVSRNDRGPVAEDLPMEHVLLQLKRSPEKAKELQEFIDELYDPNSANFHKWLTAEQFGKTFGVAPQDAQTIISWLKSHGFKVNVVYPSSMLIDFSGTAKQIREAFHTEIHYLDVKGVTHIANMGNPQIPAALAPAVTGIVSLNDFQPLPMHKMKPKYTLPSDIQNVVPADIATIYNLNPLYSAGITGKGQTIAIMGDSNVYSTFDWYLFRQYFGLSAYPGSFKQDHPSPATGGSNCIDPGVVSGDAGEEILDAEWASASAPGASIVLASCSGTDTTNGVFIALQNVINGPGALPSIISASYGECETAEGEAANAALNSAYQQAAAEGISVFVSSGNESAAACDRSEGNSVPAAHGIAVNGWSSTPYNVSVGGTDFGDTYAGTVSQYWSASNSSSYGSALSYIPEIPWNQSCGSTLLANALNFDTTYGINGLCNAALTKEPDLITTIGGSGGPSGCATGTPSVDEVVSGTCAGYQKPSWQSVFGNPNDGVRDLPDISLFASNGVWDHCYVFCYSDTDNGGSSCIGEPSNWSCGGGTSFTAPIMAGIQALVNQKAGSSQGNPDPVYYCLAASEYGHSGNSLCNSSLGSGVSGDCIFYDVTQGDTDVPCSGGPDCYMPSGTIGVLSTSSSSYQPAYMAATGWDFATGIGTVNAYNLVMNWPTSQAGAIPGGPRAALALAGNSKAYVAFQPPTSNGGSPITSYTVTSNPGNITATGTSSPITVTGLTNGTTYTFTVTATNAAGAGPASARSNAVTPEAVWIKGHVRKPNGKPVPNVTVNLTGSVSGSVVTDGNGKFIFNNVPAGTVTITPVMTGFSFHPSSITVTVNDSNLGAQNFKAKRSSTAAVTGSVNVFLGGE